MSCSKSTVSRAARFHRGRMFVQTRGLPVQLASLMRPDGRQPDQLRPYVLERGFAKFAEGSCLVKMGDTHMLVTATVEDRVPPFL